MHIYFLILLMISQQPRSTLFPYTTLFRSHGNLCTVSTQSKIFCTQKIVFGNYVQIGDESVLLDTNFHDLYDLKENRSEEHTSELQSRPHLVCRLLLEKKKYKIIKK